MSTAADFDWAQVIHELQRPDGWVKGQFGPHDEPHGGVCVLGACMRVANVSDQDSDVIYDISGPLTTVVREHFQERLGSDLHPVVAFNDHPDTTLDDVVLVCEKARAKAGELA